ncbi:MAG TPA: hypothetical protein PKE29_05020 [Phycisphaerales bacterium]|nr:hypothetical protein [Phycisphaerales bacterium]
MSQNRPVVIHQHVTPTNGLGTAGFIVSLVGLMGTCGVLSPLGMVFSFIALFKRPRGLAIAGFILGLIGSIWLVVAVFVIGIGVIAAAVGISQSP